MKSILILAENFYPAYKAGGPIQSVTNLILAIEKKYEIYVITSAYDLGSRIQLHGIQADSWEQVILPHSGKNIHVWYIANRSRGYKTLRELFKSMEPDYIYINGIFSYTFFLIPLLIKKRLHRRSELVICPRGMLQEGALSGKRLKKRIYLHILKFSGLLQNVHWHATNNAEKEDISKNINSEAIVTVAMNIPKAPLENITLAEKKEGLLRLIFLSLITQKKNLHFLLEIIGQTENISLDIYGPVKDTAYWNECLLLINKSGHKVVYHGDVLPTEVQDTFSKYHASVLLTKGENFGHAIYESLSAGRPVITSNFTPWKDLESNKAGWNLDIYDPRRCVDMLNKIKELDQAEFSQYCTGASILAKEYFGKANELSGYKKLFPEM